MYRSAFIFYLLINVAISNCASVDRDRSLEGSVYGATGGTLGGAFGGAATGCALAMVFTGPLAPIGCIAGAKMGSAIGGFAGSVVGYYVGNNIGLNADPKEDIAAKSFAMGSLSGLCAGIKIPTIAKLFYESASEAYNQGQSSKRAQSYNFFY